MRFLSKALIGTAGALALSVSAQAQTVAYNTTGTFTSGCATNGSSTCLINAGAGTSTLSFAGPTNASYSAPIAGADLGTFSLFATPSGSSSFNYNGVGFTLAIQQTLPGTGTTSTVGTFSGTFMQTGTGATGGPLILNLTNYSLNINSTVGTTTSITNYLIQQVFGGGIAITLPGALNTAANPATTTIRANISVSQTTTTPEPSTYVLMGAGLAGLVGAVRRRRTV